MARSELAVARPGAGNYMPDAVVVISEPMLV